MDTTATAIRRFVVFGAYGATLGAAIGLLTIFSSWMRSHGAGVDDLKTSVQISEPIDARGPSTTWTARYPYDIRQAQFLADPLIEIVAEQLASGDEKAALSTIDAIPDAATRDAAIGTLIMSILPDCFSNVQPLLSGELAAHPPTVASAQAAGEPRSAPGEKEFDRAVKLTNRIHDPDVHARFLIGIAGGQRKAGLKEASLMTLEAAKQQAIAIQRDHTPHQSMNAVSDTGQVYPAAVGVRKTGKEPYEGNTSQEPKLARPEWRAVLWAPALAIFGFVTGGMLAPILTAIGKIGGRVVAKASGFNLLENELDKK